MALLTKAKILAAEDRRYTTVQVPEWGGEVRLGSMSALHRQQWAAAAARFRDEGGAASESVPALVVLFCAVDENGKQLFTRQDIAELQSRDSAVIDRIAAEAARLNILTSEAAEEQKGN